MPEYQGAMGTRIQFQSEWTLVRRDQTEEIAHDLGEVPWLVDVIQSLQADGSSATEAGSDITFVKTDEDVVVTNGSSTTDYYVRVRAM